MITGVANKGPFFSIAPLDHPKRIAADLKHTTIAELSWRYHRESPGYERGFASIRPPPGHPRQADPHLLVCHQGLQQVIFLLVLHSGQICVRSPAVALSREPVHGFGDQDKPFRNGSGKCYRKNRCLGEKCSVSQQNNFNISNYIMIMIPGCIMLDQRFPEYYKTKCKKLLYHNS